MSWMVAVHAHPAIGSPYTLISTADSVNTVPSNFSTQKGTPPVPARARARAAQQLRRPIYAAAQQLVLPTEGMLQGVEEGHGRRCMMEARWRCFPCLIGFGAARDLARSIHPPPGS